MAEQNKSRSELSRMLLNAITRENIQTFILGYKKNGQPRAVYDIIKDYTAPEKKKKKDKDRGPSGKFSLYLEGDTGGKKKKKKKKNKKKYEEKYWKYEI